MIPNEAEHVREADPPRLVGGLPTYGTADRLALRFGFAMASVAGMILAVGKAVVLIAPGVLGAASLRPTGLREWVAAVVSSLAWIYVYLGLYGAVTGRLYRWTRQGRPARKEFHLPSMHPGRAVVSFLVAVIVGALSGVAWLLTYGILKALLRRLEG